MAVYRYAFVNDRPDGANRLLAQGWRPVREIAASSGTDAAGQQFLALLERDEVSSRGKLETVGGQLTVADMEGQPLFAGLAADELSDVIGVLEIREVEAGQAVFSEGETDPAIFIVLEGNVKIALPKLPVEEVDVLEATTGQVFGEASFFSGEPHSTTATAAEKTRLLRFSRDRFDDLMQAGRSSAAKIAVNAAALLGKRLGATDHWVWELHQQDQSLRVARSWNRFRRRMYELEPKSMVE